MKKIAGIRKKLDGLASNNSQTDGGSSDTEVNDHLSANQFVLAKVGRYGFPYRATCIALDPVQKLLAIGTDNGSIRICGKPGVEYHVQHDTKPNEKAVVTLLHFLINEGGLVSVVRKMVNSEMVDCSLHIWSIRQNHPALIQSLNFKNQRITALHSPFGCKWLYVGTERGNVFMVNVESFHISGYVIYWNNVVDVSHKTHPGAVINIQTNPVDPNKLLLNYDSEVCVLWDLRAKKYLYQYTPEEATKFSTCLKWHSEGKQFMCGNYDGSLATWNFKNVKKPDEHQTPHGGVKSNKENIVCCPITKLEWLVGESSLIVFSGGMAYGNQNKGLTIMRGRSKSLILSDYVVDFACLVSSPVQTEIPQPQALFVLLKNEIVVFDLTGSVGPSLPWYSLPYTFNIHESPVTCLQFYPECPSDLLFALHGLASQQNQEQANRSKKPWPLNGGTEGEVTQDPAIIITGHADGTVKFWDATSSMLIPCAKLRLSRLFNKDMSRQSSIASNNSKISDLSDDPFAIQHITLCPYGRVLSVVCQSYFLVVFKFNSKESSFETPKVDVNFLIEVASECNESPTSLNDAAMGDHFADHPNLSKSPSSHRLSSCSLTLASHPPLRSGGLRWEVGFQPALLCKQVAYEPMPNISSVAISSAYGLVCFGNSIGLAVVDYLQKCVVTVVMNYELGVPGEWTPDSAVVAKTPIGQTRSNPLSQGYEASNGFTPSASEHSTKKDRMDKRKERNSRMQYLNEHPKLTKRNSQRSSNGNIHGSTGSVSQDQIDSMFDKRDEPSAGSIQSLLFAYSYTRKSSNLLCPAVWVGTSVGDVSVLALSIPTIGSQRLVQPVLALNTGTNINCGNCVLHLAALDRSGNICNQPFEFWRDANAPNPDADRSNIQTINAESTARQFLCIATEKRIVVKSLPNFKRLSQIDPVAGSDHAEAFVVKAQTMTVNDGNCIGCLTTDGHFKIYSLPSLRMLLNVECGLADYRVVRTFAMGKGGEAVFLASPTEIQRIALTKEKEETFLDEYGCLFSLLQSPQQKPKGFFESFFSSTPSPLDREELFGPKSGNVSRSVADYVPGCGVTNLRNQADSAAGAALKARQQLFERGEKLGILSERTEEMHEKAKSFASASQALAEKYKNKKWYQL